MGVVPACHSGLGGTRRRGSTRLRALVGRQLRGAASTAYDGRRGSGGRVAGGNKETYCKLCRRVAREGQTGHNSERIFFQGLDLRLAAVNVETSIKK
jgi:hypothetical protein